MNKYERNIQQIRDRGESAEMQRNQRMNHYQETAVMYQKGDAELEFDKLKEETKKAKEVEYTEVEENNQELSKKQIARLYTISDTRGLTKDATKQFMKDMFNIESAKELSLHEYETLVKEIEKLEEVSKGE